MCMDRMGEGAVTLVKGSFTIFIGNFVSLFVMAVGSILVARMLSPSEYGLYLVSLVLPELFLLFSDWGVNSALVRFIARYRSEGEYRKIQELEKAALFFKVGVGGVLTLVLFSSADVLATIFLKRPGVSGFIRMASLLILFRSLHSTVISALAGLERMDLRAAVTIVDATVKGVSSPLLVYLGFGVSGPLIGYISGYVVSSLLGSLFMFSSSPTRSMMDEVPTAMGESLIRMLGFGMPLFFGGLVAGFAVRFRSFLLSWFVTDMAIGNYHVAYNFTRLVGLVTQSIGVTLFPAFSSLNYFVEQKKTRQAFQDSVRYSSMFVLPMICLLAVLSETVVHVLYTTKYPQAPLLLSLLLVPTLLVGSGSLSIGSFLNSQGETRSILKVGLTSSAISILMSPILIWMWGVFGLAVSIIVSGISRNVFGLYVLYKKYGFYPDLWHTLRTLLSSTISASLSFGVVKLLSAVTPIVSLFIGSGVFLLFYLFLAPVVGAIEEYDIENLDTMLKGLRVIYPFAHLLLEFENRLISLLLRYKK